MSSQNSSWKFALLFGLTLTLCIRTGAQSSPGPGAGAKPNGDEERASQLLDAARSNPTDLYNFLYRMPKGTDLHNHLTGAIYAEGWIRAAQQEQMCVDPAVPTFAPALAGACAPPLVSAAQASADTHLYDALVNAFSMRSFVPSPGVSGHDHFFDTFAKFNGIDPTRRGAFLTGQQHMGEWLDEIATRAAAQNEQYVELMDTPQYSRAAQLAEQIGWTDDPAKFRDALLAGGLRDDVAADRARYDVAETARTRIEHCGQKDEAAACHVEIRYLYQILRGLPKEIVFAQTVLGFEAASVDPRIVGINYVMPEDGYTSMHDYALHMKIVGNLHSIYPKVHISLHAGELAPGLVPYEGLCCHIRLAVEQAHAERIGHGVDVMYEDHPYDLLREMAAKHVMVEINLTSNDVILGVTGKNHPLPTYRRLGVPVALSTDDEGVSRINLTHEYVRAVESYDLHYSDLKKMVREGMEHAFLPGDSLWAKPETFGTVVSACSQDSPGKATTSKDCASLLQKSEKARQEWELERRFRAFEASPSPATSTAEPAAKTAR
jgi:adenosine deaminase